MPRPGSRGIAIPILFDEVMPGGSPPCGFDFPVTSASLERSGQDCHLLHELAEHVGCTILLISSAIYERFSTLQRPCPDTPYADTHNDLSAIQECPRFV